MSYLCGGLISWESVLVLLLSVNIATAADAVQYTVGNANIFGDVLQKTVLFNKNAANQKNYTIRYKYVDNLFGGAVSFAQMNVTGAQNSTSEMDHSKDFNMDMNVAPKHFVDATLNVFNATNLTSSIEVRGFRGINMGDYMYNLNLPNRKPRSYAFICTQNDDKMKSPRNALIEHGKRATDDFLIHYRQERCDNNGMLSFNFHDPNLKLTHIVVNVDSPWAITFKNKIITSDDRFSAKIYELKRNNFTAELFIFGRNMTQS